MLRGMALAFAFVCCACGARLEQRRAVYAGTTQLRYDGQAKESGSQAAIAEGSWRFWFRDGALQALGDFSAGSLVRADDEAWDRTSIPIAGRSGRWTTWNENGIELSEGSYRDGRREGMWFEWHDDGTLKRRGEYRHGLATGPHVAWHSNGQKKSAGEFRDDREWGVHRTWDEHGRLRRQGEYRAGSPVGLHRTWDECGVLREETSYKDGFLNGTRRLWDSAGRPSCISEYVRGLQHGPQVLCRKDGGVKQSASFTAGHPDGMVIAYDEDGRKEWQLEYRAGDAGQRLTSWHANGTLCAEHFTLGSMPEGMQREWYDDGSPRSSGVSVAGRMEGEWRFWTRTGTLDRERSGEYSAGVKLR